MDDTAKPAGMSHALRDARRQAAWSASTLFFAAPALAELLSGSSPPREYFQPLTIIALHLSYGALAVLLREWAVRCRLGFWGRVILALTVGIYIEGIVCKSLFSPMWPDFSLPLGYGRLWGVNWPWLVNLLLYHGLNSLLVPWLLADLLFPLARSTPVLGPRSMGWLALSVVATGVLGWTFIPMNLQTGAVYHPGWLAAVLCWSALVLLPLLAARVPRQRCAGMRQPPQPNLAGWLVGLGWLGFVALQYAGEIRHWSAPWVIALNLAYAMAALWIAKQWSGSLGLAHKYAIFSGSTWFWAILAVFQEINNPKRPDDTSGMSVLGILAVLGLFVLRHRLHTHYEWPINKG